jgi:hypothetical protein
MMFQWKFDQGDKSKISTKRNILDLIDASLWLDGDDMYKNGIGPGQCQEAANMLGLKARGTYNIDAFVLTNTLKMHGPIWIAGAWIKGRSHVIVLTGCDPEKGTVYLVNPWDNNFGVESTKSIAELNDRGDLWRNCEASIMYW